MARPTTARLRSLAWIIVAPTLFLLFGTWQLQRSVADAVLAYAALDRRRSIVLLAEEVIYAGSLDSVSLAGAVPGRIAILSTTYASRPNWGQPRLRCRHGNRHPDRRATPDFPAGARGAGR